MGGHLVSSLWGVTCKECRGGAQLFNITYKFLYNLVLPAFWASSPPKSHKPNHVAFLWAPHMCHELSISELWPMLSFSHDYSCFFDSSHIYSTTLPPHKELDILPLYSMIPCPYLGDRTLLRMQPSMEHGSVLFALSHQNIAHDRQLIRSCWKNTTMNGSISVDTLGDWVGKESSKAQRQGSSVPLAEQEGFGLSERGNRAPEWEAIPWRTNVRVSVVSIREPLPVFWAFVVLLRLSASWDL